jgi:hypothetical protein
MVSNFGGTNETNGTPLLVATINGTSPAWTNLVGLSATVQADNSVLHNGFTPDLLQGSCEGFIAIPGASATLRVDTWHDVIPATPDISADEMEGIVPTYSEGYGATGTLTLAYDWPAEKNPLDCGPMPALMRSRNSAISIHKNAAPRRTVMYIHVRTARSCPARALNKNRPHVNELVRSMSVSASTDRRSKNTPGPDAKMLPRSTMNTENSAANSMKSVIRYIQNPYKLVRSSCPSVCTGVVLIVFPCDALFLRG